MQDEKKLRTFPNQVVAAFIFGLLLLRTLFQPSHGKGDAEETNPRESERVGWRLTFEDNFEGDQIDDTKWNILPMGQPLLFRGDQPARQVWNTFSSLTARKRGGRPRVACRKSRLLSRSPLK